MRMNFRNLEIKEKIAKHRLKYYEVAEEIGIQPNTLTHWFQIEMNDRRKKAVLDAIERIVEREKA